MIKIANKEREARHEKGIWDKSSKNESDRNYVVGAQTMGNPWNNTKNPNWNNQMFKQPYNAAMLNDPQRVEENHRTEDNNGNKKLMKDERYRDDLDSREITDFSSMN